MNKTKNNLRIIRKSWKVNFGKISEGYLFDPSSVLAENVNHAKKLLLGLNPGMFLSSSDDEVTYLTIPVSRNPSGDLIIYDGKEMLRSDVYAYIKSKERSEDLRRYAESSYDFFYIKKGCYYYRKGSQGYSEYLFMAGVFNKKDAIKEAEGCDKLELVPIASVSEHNAYVSEQINKLKENLIVA